MSTFSQSTSYTSPKKKGWLLFVGFSLRCLWGIFTGCPQHTSKTLHIFAASSLTESFRALKQAFEKTHPTIHVSLTFAGSQVLRLQLEQGAYAHLFASANQTHIQRLKRSGHVTKTHIFANNTLALIVPSSNPANIKTFEDLPRARRLVVGTKHVPIGMYTERLFKRATHQYGPNFGKQVHTRIISREKNVRLVRAKIAMRVADAAIVYHTDTLNQAGIQTIPIPKTLNVKAIYEIAQLKRAPTYTKQWLQFIVSPSGRDILKRYGFGVSE